MLLYFDGMRPTADQPAQTALHYSMLGRLSRLFASIDHRTLRELNRLEQYQKVLDLYERTQFTDSTERELSRRQFTHALAQKTAQDLSREQPASEKAEEKPADRQADHRPLFTENVGPEMSTRKLSFAPRVNVPVPVADNVVERELDALNAVSQTLKVLSKITPAFAVFVSVISVDGKVIV